MNHTQVRNAALSILVLTSSMLPSVTAHSQSIPRRLEGTQWKAVTELTLKSGDDLRMEAEYTFAEKGKVAADYERELKRQRQPRYNPQTDRYEERLDYALVRSDPIYEIGTYELNGSSIHLEFPFHHVEATIKGNRMEGFITLQPNKEYKRWVAGKVVGSIPEQPPSNIDSEQKYMEFLGEASRLMQLMKYWEAIDQSTRAINLNPNSHRAYFLRARIKATLQEYRAAIEDYDEIIRRTSDQIIQMWAYRKRGDVKLESNNYRGAIVDYDLYTQLYEAAVKVRGSGRGIKAIDLEPSPPYYNRGLAKDRVGDKVGACDDFRRACRLGHRASACVKAKAVCN